MRKIRKGVRVEVPDFPQRGPEWFPTPTVAESAHKVTEPTPCRVCGGGIARATPHEQWGPWRQHRDCQKIAALNGLLVQAAAAALGVAVLTREDALLVKWTVATYATNHEPIYPDGMKTRDKMPWRHVDKRALTQAVAEIPRLRVRAGLDPSRCESGACAICGVVEARGWMTTDLRWRDGSPAPVCGDCYRAFLRNSEPTFTDDLAPVVAECLTGIAPNMGEYVPTGLVPFVSSDGAPGERWGYLPAAAVDAYRWAKWVQSPDRAPAEHRAEARARKADQDRERAEATAARERAERERLDSGYGFTQEA